jgi:hypothetical protein
VRLMMEPETPTPSVPIVRAGAIAMMPLVPVSGSEAAA